MSYDKLPLPGYAVQNRCRGCPHSTVRRQPFPFFCNGRAVIIDHPYCQRHAMSLSPSTVCPDLARLMELDYNEVHNPP